MTGLPTSSPARLLKDDFAQLPARTFGAWVRLAMARLAIQDWLILTYHTALVAIVLVAPRSDAWPPVAASFFALLAFVVVTLAIVRAQLFPHEQLSGHLYRILMLSTVQVSYYELGKLLPLVRPESLDRELYAFDLQVFGFEPAMAMEAWISHGLTEWFSFAYYGYFAFLLLHVAPMLFLSRHERATAEFSLGLLIVFCIGHLLYFVVPGVGPGVAMSGAFERDLGSGFWTDLMNSTVQSLGAHRDIFPSIHTAAPVYLCLWGYRYRKSPLFGRLLVHVVRRVPWLRPAVRWLQHAWILAALFTFNIVLATMYLRWHYLADVVAGVLLAVLGFVLSRRWEEQEDERRRTGALGPVWPILWR